MSTLNPLISNFLANSFCPPYSLRWNGRITLHNQGKVNQRVLSPGRWFSSGFIAHVWPGNPRCRLNRVPHCKNTPRPLRGVSIPYNLSLSLFVGAWLLSLSLVALWMGAQFPSLIFCSLNNKLTTNSSANQSNPTATHFSTFPLLGSSSSSHPLLPTLSSPS